MIEIFSPLRVDICGGTLDCWPLYLLLPQAKTINFGIDLGTRVRLEEREDVLIQLKDLQYTQSFKSVEAVVKAPDRELDLIRPALRFFCPSPGFLSGVAIAVPGGWRLRWQLFVVSWRGEGFFPVAKDFLRAW